MKQLEKGMVGARLSDPRPDYGTDASQQRWTVDIIDLEN